VDVGSLFLFNLCAETPKDVIKVYRADQSHRFVCVGRDTTASDAVAHACKEFMITDNVENYALYRVSGR